MFKANGILVILVRCFTKKQQGVSVLQN